MPDAAPSPTPESSEQTELGIIAREMVRLFKQQFGRGPTKARAHWAGPDSVVSILEDTFTPAERKLIELGQHQSVHDMRNALQHATVPELCAPVEAATGRKVRAFTSAIDTNADGLAVEIWTLHPPGYEGMGRVEIGEINGELKGTGGRRERDDAPEGIGPVRPA